MKFKIIPTFISDEFYDCEIIKINMSKKTWEILVTSDFDINKHKEYCFAIYICEDHINYNYIAEHDKFKDGDIMFKVFNFNEIKYLKNGIIYLKFKEYNYYTEAKDFNNYIKKLSRINKINNLIDFLK